MSMCKLGGGRNSGVRPRQAVANINLEGGSELGTDYSKAKSKAIRMGTFGEI